eukprot:424594-Amorphochlora_amoeboformis.AAC.1
MASFTEVTLGVEQQEDRSSKVQQAQGSLGKSSITSKEGEADPIGDLMVDDAKKDVIQPVQNPSSEALPVGSRDQPRNNPEAQATEHKRGFAGTNPSKEAPPKPKSKTTSHALIADVSNRSTMFWVPDSAVTNCGKCKGSFGFLTRKHHCRMCGQIFCNNCSQTKLSLPRSFGWGDCKVRVCDICRERQNAPANPEDALIRRLSTSGKPEESNHGEERAYILHFLPSLPFSPLS